MSAAAPGYWWAVAIYDWIYRLWHNLIGEHSEIGPALRIEVQHSRSRVQLADGTRIEPGDWIGLIHLNNDRVRSLHGDGASPAQVGLKFRRQLLASLHDLARLTEHRGRLNHVKAFSATTIFHHGLKRLGFETAPDRLRHRELVAFYQRALLSSLHPAGSVRAKRGAYQHAERLWISRERLQILHGREPAKQPRTAPATQRWAAARAATQGGRLRLSWLRRTL